MTRFALAVALSILVSPFAVFAQQGQGLRELCPVDGNTFVLELRYAEGQTERLPDLARELVRLKVDVVVTSTDLAIAATTQQTRTIPIMMATSIDPLGTGLVASLARPGGKCDRSHHDVPGTRRQAAGTTKGSRPQALPEIRGAVLDYNQTEGAARSLGLQLRSAARELVDLRVDVIWTGGGAETPQAAMNAKRRSRSCSLWPTTRCDWASSEPSRVRTRTPQA